MTKVVENRIRNSRVLDGPSIGSILEFHLGFRLRLSNSKVFSHHSLLLPRGHIGESVVGLHMDSYSFPVAPLGEANPFVLEMVIGT